MIHEIEAARHMQVGGFYQLSKVQQVDLLAWWRVHLNPQGKVRR